MTKKYVIETESGSLYKIEDVSHLFGSDRWCIFEKGMGSGNRDAILWLGKLMNVGGVLAGVHKAMGESPSKIKVLEHSIEQALRTRSCIGQCVFYTSEQNFEKLIKWITEVHDPRNWKKVEGYVTQTTKIVQIYE